MNFNITCYVLLAILLKLCHCSLWNKFVRNIVKPSNLLIPLWKQSSDDCYLLEFVVGQSNNCEQMEQVVRRLELDLQTKVKRLDIQHPEYNSLFEFLNGGEGGGLPFFYNRRTANAVCGPMTYRNLRKWAMGDPKIHYIHSIEESLPTPRTSRTKDMFVEMIGGSMLSRMGLKRAGLGTAKSSKS